MSESFTEKAGALFDEIHRIFYLEGVEAGMAKLEEAVQNLEEFSEQEQEHFRNIHLIWTRALNLSYFPPHPSHELEVYPLYERYRHRIRFQPAEAERALWAYVQRCAFGTIAFHNALDTLVEFAVRTKNFPLGRRAAGILLHHYAIINLVRFNPLMPVGYGDPSSKHEWPDGEISLYLPWWPAMDALEEDPAQCWIDILELQLEITPLEKLTEWFYPEVLEALRKHYRKTNNLSRLEWLKVYELE